MRRGKLPAGSLKRTIIKELEKQDVKTAGLLAGGFGAKIRTDAPVLRLPGIVNESIQSARRGRGGLTDSPKCLVTSTGSDPDALSDACNHALACAAVPISAQITCFLPEDLTEPEFKSHMRQLKAQAKRLGIVITGGDTLTRARLTNVLTTATVTAITDFTAVKQLTGARPGQALILAGLAGQAGMRSLFPSIPERICQDFRPDFLEKTYGKEEDGSVQRAAKVCREALYARRFGISAMHAVGHGGVLAGLWEFSVMTGETVGFTVDMNAIPIRQGVIELAQCLDLDPYTLYAGGCLLIAADDGKGLATDICQQGTPAAVIGQFTDTRDKILLCGGRKRFLDKPQPDAALDFGLL